MPKERKPVETFPDYLRRVGNDYKNDGAEFTAEDYFKAADEIEALMLQLKHVQTERNTARAQLGKAVGRISALAKALVSEL